MHMLCEVYTPTIFLSTTTDSLCWCSTGIERYIPMEYIYFPNGFFDIFHAQLALMFVYCLYKYCVAKLSHCIVRNHYFIKYSSFWKTFWIKVVCHNDIHIISGINLLYYELFLRRMHCAIGKDRINKAKVELHIHQGYIRLIWTDVKLTWQFLV